MFHAARMIDMAQSPTQVKETAPMAVGAPKPSAPVFPYGLCISFDEETLRKLGFDGELPPVGTMFHFCAGARVTSTSENETQIEDGSRVACRRVECQIVQMGIPAASVSERGEEASMARRDKLYSSSHKEADGEEA